jgi:putative acetyltransferase
VLSDVQVVEMDAASDEVTRLVAALDAELWTRYPKGPIHGIDIPEFKAHGGVFIVVKDGGEAQACGAYRPYAPGTIEIKRMFVQPHARGRGYSRLILQALEDHARGLGFKHVLLQTGDGQPEAMGLYDSAGYVRIPNYGEYIHTSYSICFAKSLEQKEFACAG